MKSAVRTNMLEEHEADLDVRGDRVELDLRPFEIVTLRFALR